MLNSIPFIFSSVLAFAILFSFTAVAFGQTLDKTYSSFECGVSIKYPSNWVIEEIKDDEVGVLNSIVDIQPNNENGFRNVVNIELDDISSLSARSFQDIKEFEEESLSTLGDLAKIISSETAQVGGGFTAQKIVYTEGLSGTPENDRSRK